MKKPKLKQIETFDFSKYPEMEFYAGKLMDNERAAYHCIEQEQLDTDGDRELIGVYSKGYIYLVWYGAVYHGRGDLSLIDHCMDRMDSEEAKRTFKKYLNTEIKA